MELRQKFMTSQKGRNVTFLTRRYSYLRDTILTHQGQEIQ